MQPLIAVVALPLLFFLPGFVTLRGVLAQRSRQPDPESRVDPDSSGFRPPDLIEGIALSVSASFLISSVAAFTLVLFGVFSLWLLLAVVGSYVVLAAVVTRIRRPRALVSPAVRPSAQELCLALGAIVMVFLAVLLYSRAPETVLLTRDPSTYVNTAVHIAKTGGSLIEDPLYYSLEDGLQKALVYERPVDPAKERSGGFQIEYRLRGFPRDAGLGQTTPQFFNLFPTWLAIGYGMFGMWGIFLVSPLFGAFSVLLVFLVGRRLFGTPAGMAAAALLLVNLAHFWWARTPSSEVTFQLTFLSGVLFWALFSTGKNRLFGAFAGVGFGALTLIRIDSTLVLGAILVMFLYLAAAGKTQRRDLFFLVPLVGVSALGLTDALYSSRPYVSLLFRMSDGTTLALGGLVILALIAVLAAAFPGLKLRSLLRRVEMGHGVKLRLAAAFGLVGLGILAYFARPVIQETMGLNELGLLVPKHKEDSFIRLGWYLSPVGIALATLGAAILVWRGNSRAWGLFLLISLVTTLYYLFDPRVRPDHFWAIRRFVPIAIPFSLLCIGYVVQLLSWRYAAPWSPPEEGSASAGTAPDEVASKDWLRPIRRLGGIAHPGVIAVGLLMPLLGFSILQIWGFVPYRDQEGSADAVEQIAVRFPGDAVIVFDNTALGNILAPPLKLIHGLETFVLGPAGSSESHHTLCGADSAYPSSDHPRSCILAKLMTAAESRPFFWVAGTNLNQPQIVRERFEQMDGGRVRVAVPILEQLMTRLPDRSDVGVLRYSGVVYRAR